MKSLRSPSRVHFFKLRLEFILDHENIMSSIGPELPPHLLAKRKRQNIDDDNAPAPTRSRTTSPTSSSDGGEKRRRILGPSLPPAPLDERPTTSPDLEKDSDSDSDDDLGPALPPPTGSYSHQAEVQRLEALEQETSAREAAKKPQREEWMLVPPKQDDWSSRVDPTKLKNRKFNTGKGAKAPSQKGGSDNALWTETPEQKRQRLEDEVMGVKTPAQLDTGSKKSSTNEAEARETERRIREYNVRSPSTHTRLTHETVCYFFSSSSSSSANK